MSILNRGYIVLVITLSIGFFTGTTLAANTTKGGISDQTNNVVMFSKITKLNKKINTIGNNAVSDGATDTTAEAASTLTCDFRGFAQGDLVNRAYAGGTSAGGVTKVNNGIAFNGATVLNTYNGNSEPDPGIVYSSSTGIMVISLENVVPSQVSFAYTSTVALTVAVYSSADGTGTAIGSYVANLNVTGTTYNAWTTFTKSLASTVRSIKITGAADKFGIDQVVVTAVNPSPTITSVSPTYGSQFGGTAFTLNGTNFTGATSVKIGGVAATNLVVVSATQITAVTPFSSTFGAKDVVVTTPAGSFTAAASFTYTAAVPVLALTNNAGSCNPIGAVINVDATLSGVVSPIVAGQIYITWNPAKMTLNYPIDAGDAPFIQVNTINRPAGTALILVSLEQGGSAISVQSKVVARMHFTVVGGSCDGSGTDIQFFPDGTLPTEFTDGVGGKMVPALVASSGFKVDDGAPVLSNVPADVSVQAEAGMGSFATVALTPPTATDACAPGLTASSSRSDGAALSAAFPVGTTTVTWSATDPCANATTATTRVTVNNANTATFAVSYTNSASYAASSARTLTLNIHGANGYTLKASQPVTLVRGAGTISLTDLAVDNYDCVAVEEKGRSLRRVATMTDGGLVWSSTATLVAGDLINDEVIDVLDWGAYIVGNPNADLDGNGAINATDGNIIIANFGQKGETGCGTSFMSPPEPISAISVAELVDRGLTDLVAADLNNDGWLDMEDVRMASNGGRMNKDGWWDVAVARSAD